MERRIMKISCLLFCVITLVKVIAANPNRQLNPESHVQNGGKKLTEQPDHNEVNRVIRAPANRDTPQGKDATHGSDVSSSPPLKRKSRNRLKKGRRLRSFLAASPECSEDISRLCSKSERVDNFVIIDCLQRDSSTAQTVSDVCQNLIWQFKRNMTKSTMFEAASNRICDSSFKKINECQTVPAGGQRVACMFEHKDKLDSEECVNFLNKVGAILFSDYHLIYKFEQKCSADILKLKCGRLSEGPDPDSKGKMDQPSSQGRTIECLMESVDKVSQECNHEILRVSELQADDFHLDRPLYFACREDRENFCEKVHAGQGRVYKCLMKNMNEETMSAQCKKELIHRMQMRELDYKVDYSFAGVCAKDVAAHECASSKHAEMMKSGLKPMAEAMSHIILCLENVIKIKGHVSPECKNEMLTIRKQLMSDYKLTPEIVHKCSEPIKEFCDNGLHHKGRTLHCLMEQFITKSGHPSEMEKYKDCKEAIHLLIKVADAGSDYRVDPVIVFNCQEDIVKFCQTETDSPSHQGAIYSCLLKKMSTHRMSAKCSESLVELQYIVSRDFTLDPQLFGQCKNDAASICGASSAQWYTGKHHPIGGVIFSCLINQLRLKEESEEDADDEDDESKDDGETKARNSQPVKRISKGCGDEVLRVLRERSSQIMLNPYVYDHCLGDLAKKCTSRGHGQSEMECLQDNLNDLTPNCAKMVRNMAEEQDRHPSLNVILSRSCAPMIQMFCRNELKDVQKIFPCLIKHKDHPEMVTKCRAGVEHHQIISMKDFHISTAFRRNCAKDLHINCPDIKTKSEAVICLSEKIRNATLLEKRIPLSKGCYQQIRVENFQKSQDIRLSPRIQRFCEKEIQQFCSKVPFGKRIKCLRQLRWKELSRGCQKVLFDRRQLEFLDSRIDARLQRVCRPMIKHYCSRKEVTALDCLWQHIHDENFDPKCRRVVYLRLETRVKDYRLDPLLNQLCKRDMRHYCVEFMDPKQTMTGTDYRNNMLICLKTRFKKFELSSNCHGYMRQLIVEINMNHHLDATLRTACTKDVQRVCGAELEETEGDDGDGRVTECLKRGLQNKRIKEMACQQEVLRLMDESRADVHVDPVLYKACLTELNTICGHVQLGNGRQMSCLLWAKDDKEARKGMSFTCRKQVKARVEMWEKAARAASPNTLNELAIQVNSSDSRHYFFAFFTLVVLGIFIVGLCCGRVTKRVYIDAKNK